MKPTDQQSGKSSPLRHKKTYTTVSNRISGRCAARLMLMLLPAVITTPRLTGSSVQGKAGMGKRRGKDAAADWVGTKVVFDDANPRAGDSCDAQLPAAKQEAASGMFARLKAVLC